MIGNLLQEPFPVDGFDCPQHCVGTIEPRVLPFLRVSNVHVVQVDEGFRFIYRENRPDVFAERGVGPRPDQGVYC